MSIEDKKVPLRTKFKFQFLKAFEVLVRHSTKSSNPTLMNLSFLALFINNDKEI